MRDVLRWTVQSRTIKGDCDTRVMSVKIVMKEEGKSMVGINERHLYVLRAAFGC